MHDLFEMVADGRLSAGEAADILMLEQELRRPKWLRAARWLAAFAAAFSP